MQPYTHTRTHTHTHTHTHVLGRYSCPARQENELQLCPPVIAWLACCSFAAGPACMTEKNSGPQDIEGREKDKENYGGRGNSPHIKEKETHWLRRAVSPLHHEATKQKMLMGTWRVAGSNRLQELAVRSITVYKSTPSCNKLIGLLNRMGMKSASKLNGTLGGQVPVV
eukprot:1162070-Pelagomonas_calceolata.AAC.14